MKSPSPIARGHARWRCALITSCVAAWAVTAVAAAPAAPATPLRGGPTLGDCQHLLRQFDVAWATHRDSPRAEGARRSRDQGEAECREGHYGEGIHHLRRALHDIGLKPVKRVAHPAAR